MLHAFYLYDKLKFTQNNGMIFGDEVILTDPSWFPARLQLDPHADVLITSGEYRIITREKTIEKAIDYINTQYGLEPF